LKSARSACRATIADRSPPLSAAVAKSYQTPARQRTMRRVPMQASAGEIAGSVFRVVLGGARHPRYHVHFTRTSASWLHQVERWFAMLADKQIKRGVIAVSKNSTPTSPLSFTPAMPIPSLSGPRAPMPSSRQWRHFARIPSRSMPRLVKRISVSLH
jgi:hypothetical protein